MRTILMLLPLLAAVLLHAEDTAAQQLKVREMIQEVQNAPEGERYQKMNEFKKMIRSMNAEKRTEAIAQMQKAMAKDEPAKTQAKTQTRTQSRKQMQDLQNQQSQQQMQQRNQMMNQQQMKQMMQTPMTQPKVPGEPKFPQNGMMH